MIMCVFVLLKDICKVLSSRSFFFKKFPKFVVVHTIKGFGIVNKVEVDIFLELFLFK